MIGLCFVILGAALMIALSIIEAGKTIARAIENKNVVNVHSASAGDIHKATMNVLTGLSSVCDAIERRNKSEK